MKNIRKALVALCLVAVLLVGAIFTVIATTDTVEYTGTMEGLNELVSAVEAELGAEEPSYSKIEKAVEKVADYLTKTPVDPTLEGYAEAMAKVYSAAVTCAVNYVTFGDDAKTEDIEKGLASAEELIALFPDIDTAADDYVAYDEQAKAVAAELAESYLAVADTAAVVADAYAALTSAKAYIDAYALTELADAYDAAVLKAAATGYAGAALTQGEDGLWNTADAGSKINALVAFLAANPLNTELEGAAELQTNVNNLKATLAEKIAENLATLDELNLLAAYDTAFELTEDFSGFNVGEKVTGAINKFNGPAFYGSSYFEIEEDSTGNKYLALNTVGAPGQGSYMSYSFSKMVGKPDQDGFIIEFKAKTDAEHTDGRLQVEPGGYGPSDGRFFPTKYFEVGAADGTMKPGENDKSGTTVPSAVTADEWTHFMIQFNPADFTLSLYCNGQLVTTFSAKYNGQTFNYADSTGHGLRLVVYGEDATVYVDDVHIYTGSGYRNPNKLTDMTDEERFIYYVNYAAYSDDPIGRQIAYDGAGKLLGKYYADGEYLTENDDVIAAIDIYNNEIDPEEIALLVANSNRDEFIDLVKALDEIPRTAANLVERTTAHDKVVKFLADNLGKITEDSDFQAAKRNFDDNLVREVSIDTSIESFNLYMQRFNMIDALSGKQKYLSKAKALVEAEIYALSYEVYEELKALVDSNNKPAFPDFVDYYEDYDAALETVASMERDEEAKKVVACVGFIEGYKTEAEWIENYDFMNRYIVILRETVRLGEYNPDFPGVEEALATLAPMEEWFYARLQDQHQNELRRTIDQIAANDSYIVKMGLCSYAERYLNENDIDLTYGEIPLLLVEFKTHQEELTYREMDYAELLVQNSYYFKSLVDTMVLSDTYADIKYYYDMAYSYYFSIDASVEGVQERIDIFDSYTVIVDLAENSSRAFKENAVALEVIYADENATDEDIYYALVACYEHLANIKTDIEGVADAVEAYVAIADEYLAEIAENNGELYAAISMMGSLRAGSGVSPIISVAMKFIFD